MYPSRSLLRRRELLGALGAGAFLAVPVFRQSLAEAQGAAPKRAIFVQWPDGVPSACFQLGMCRLNELPDLKYFDFDGQLASFAALKADTIIMQNLRAFAAEKNSEEGHEAGMASLLTGRSSRGGTSVDQYIAKQVGNLTRFSSLQFGGYPYTFGGPQDRISYADGFDLAPERDPVVMFEKLFSGAQPAPGGGAPDPAITLRLAQKKSTLDFLKAEITAVEGATGAAEKPLLDLHLESLREIEKQLTQVAGAAGTACAPPDQGGAVKGQYVGGEGGEIDAQMLAKLQLDLLYQAINCDLTRIATFQWAPSVEVLVKYDWVPGFSAAPDQHHAFAHDHESPANEAIFQGIQNWFTSQTAGLVARMKATAEGGGSLLDNSVVMYASEMSNGTHVLSPLPVLLAGRGGGSFQNLGTKLDAKGAAHNDLLLSIAAYMGAPMAAIGDNGLSKGPLTL